MTDRRKTRRAGLALLGAIALAAAVAQAADAPKGDDWENRFAGHELWMTSLDKAIALSAKQSKPLLIDFYSHG
jgi:hypothetical protein